MVPIPTRLNTFELNELIQPTIAVENNVKHELHKIFTLIHLNDSNIKK